MSGRLFEERGIPSDQLGSKEQENLNVTRLISALAQRGVECFRVNNDKHCADVIAHNPRTGVNLNLQVKGNRRIVVQETYTGRDVWMVTYDPNRNSFLIFNHDDALEAMRATGRWMKKGQTGTSNGAFSDDTVSLLIECADGEWLTCDP